MQYRKAVTVWQLAKDGNVTLTAVNRKPDTALRRVMDRLLPQPCRFCGASGSEHRTGCCSACRADLPWAVPGCRRCALPLTGGLPKTEYLGGYPRI